MFSKYAYHAPKSKDEFIESVALELRHSGERPNQWPRTVKDLLGRTCKFHPAQPITP